MLTGQHLKLTTPQDVITARDTLEYWSQKHMAVGRGNAVMVTNDGRRIAGDMLIGYPAPPDPVAAGRHDAGAAQPVPAPTPGKPPPDPLLAASGKLQKVDAIGHVEMRTTADTVRGDRGVYLPDTGMARVARPCPHHPRRQPAERTGAVVNMKTGIAHMIAPPAAGCEGLIMPNTSQTAQPGGKATAPP